MSKKVALLVAILILLAWAGWASFLVWQFGFDLTSGERRPFESSGQFGDSFGVLAALMSMLAIIGALYSIHIQSENYNRQQFEHSLFTLLANLRCCRDDISLSIMDLDGGSMVQKEPEYYRLAQVATPTKKQFKGVEAISVFVFRIREHLGPNGYADPKKVGRVYRRITADSNTLGNYFRMLYHIYLMVERSSVLEKQFYGRIIRSHLTQSELCLLAYNCIVDEGRYKFARLLEEYYVLHNLKRENLDPYESPELRFFTRKLGERAFRFDPIEPLAY